MYFIVANEHLTFGDSTMNKMILNIFLGCIEGCTNDRIIIVILCHMEKKLEYRHWSQVSFSYFVPKAILKCTDRNALTQLNDHDTNTDRK